MVNGSFHQKIKPKTVSFFGILIIIIFTFNNYKNQISTISIYYKGTGTSKYYLSLI